MFDAAWLSIVRYSYKMELCCMALKAHCVDITDPIKIRGGKKVACLQ